MCNPSPARKDQGGVTLIETLIALLLVSGGLLALVQMQMLGLRTATSATLRDHAVLLAGEMLERIRNNPPAIETDDYVVAFNELPDAGTRHGDDIRAWKTAIASSLAGGEGAIGRTGRLYTITVRWDESWDTDLDDGLAVVELRTEL